MSCETQATQEETPVYMVPAISPAPAHKYMDKQDALAVLVWATACAAVGVTAIVTIGILFSPGDLAVFSKVERVTTITIAGRAAILIVSALGAGVGAQVEIAVCTRSFIARKWCNVAHFQQAARTPPRFPKLPRRSLHQACIIPKQKTQIADIDGICKMPDDKFLVMNDDFYDG